MEEERSPPQPDLSIKGLPHGWDDSENVNSAIPASRSRFRDRLNPLNRYKRKPNSLHSVESADPTTSSLPSLDPATPFYAPSVPSNPSSRELSFGYGPTGGTFYPEELDPVLPFATKPFCAGPQIGTLDGGWTVSKQGKRTWNGQDPVYKPGYERTVLDAEAAMHNAVYDAFGTNSLVEAEPAMVLDIGTGLGLWPISQALVWRRSKFVGLDLVPCQVDLRTIHDGSLFTRIEWHMGDFLQPLAYDTASFDMVHIRFIGLGVPETKWTDLLDEATRVLKPGGRLEIVEMNYPLVTSAFAAMLQRLFIQPLPATTINFSLPITPGIAAGIEQRQAVLPGSDVCAVWAKSALSRGQPRLARLKTELHRLGWKVIPEAEDGDVTASIWVATRK